jgi:tetratricopeptide (TPR) repeat protein
MAVVGPLAMLLPFLPEIHGTWLHYRGNHPKAARVFRRLAERSSPGGQRALLNRLNEGACWLAAGDIDAGKAALAPVDLEDLGPLARAIQCVNLSHLYWQLGDGESALQLAEAAESQGFLGTAFLRVYAVGNAAQALVQLGRFEEAAARLDAWRTSRVPWVMRDQWRALRAMCHLDSGEPDRAREGLAGSDAPLADLVRALLAWRLDGDREPARKLAEQLPERHESLDAITRAIAQLVAARAAGNPELAEEVPGGGLRDRLEAWLEKVLEEG